MTNPGIPISFSRAVTVFKGRRLYENNYLVRRELPPGVATWIENAHDGFKHAAMRFTCPCGCGYVQAVSIAKAPDGHGWEWDGNVEKPTLSPSIQCLSPCRWHGFLKNGVFEQC